MERFSAMTGANACSIGWQILMASALLTAILTIVDADTSPRHFSTIEPSFTSFNSDVVSSENSLVSVVTASLYSSNPDDQFLTTLALSSHYFGRQNTTANLQSSDTELLVSGSYFGTADAETGVVTDLGDASPEMTYHVTTLTTTQLYSSQFQNETTTQSQHTTDRFGTESNSGSSRPLPETETEPQSFSDHDSVKDGSTSSPEGGTVGDDWTEGSTMHGDTVTPPSRDGPLCLSSAIIPVQTDGTLSWPDSQTRCNGGETSWHLIAPADYGLSFQFHEVQMTQGRSLEIKSYDSVQQTWKVERLYLDKVNMSASNSNIDQSPLLVNHSQVDIIVHPAQEQAKDTSASFFNISYFVHRKDAMPESKIGYDSSLTQYKCSAGSIPQALLCNMVPECEQGEDEENCDYRQAGCDEGWIPYKHQCLRLDFTFSCLLLECELQIGLQHPNLLANAELFCQRWYDAELAVLPDKSAIEFVASVTRQSGLRSVSLNIKKFQPQVKKLHDMYRYMWQWGGKGGSLAHEQQELEHLGAEYNCAMLDVYPRPRFVPTDCVRFTQLVYPHGFVCSKPNPNFQDSGPAMPRPQMVTFPRAIHKIYKNGFPEFNLKECSDGSLVHTFDRCVWGDGKTGAEWSPNNFALFRCRHGLQVHYTLVCDGKEDCADGSDEYDCRGRRYRSWLGDTFVCDNKQVLRERDHRCDGVMDCFDASDEENCLFCKIGMAFCSVSGCVHRSLGLNFPSCPHLTPTPVRDIPVPGVVRLSSFGVSEIDPVSDNETQFLFLCHPGFYVPSYLVGNGEVDCMGGQDEDIRPENMICPGHYRCQDYGFCIHINHVCDGIYHCPNKDDELYCIQYPCPDNCTCEGYGFACQHMFDIWDHPDVRYLDLNGVKGLSTENFYQMEFLRFLNLSHCGLENVTLSKMPQLLVLDLSFNNLTELSSLILKDLESLTYLDLSGNPLVPIIDSTFRMFLKNASFRNLRSLVLQNTDLHVIQDKSLDTLKELVTLDLRGSPIETYDKDVFKGLNKLAQVYTDDSRLCCSYFHPTKLRDCHSPIDELSSCSDLLRADFFRVALWVMSVLAIFGNASVIVYRFFINNTGPPAFRLLVVNLCTSDLLMGLYMLIIGAADLRFRHVYVSMEKEWRESAACTTAGFLAFVSSEASNFIICLITLDRFIVLTFPWKRHLHMTVKASAVACGTVWTAAVALASVPFVFHSQFYEQSAVCLPLPITRRQFPGHRYAFGVFIVLNFSLTLLIGLGQLLIYRAVRQASSAVGSPHQDQEVSMARRLFLVVFSDMCCWLPVTLMGVLAARSTPVGGEVQVWTAILLLPINSALNPFLYTLNGALQRLQKRREARKMKRMVGRLQAHIPKWQAALVQETARICIQTRQVPWSKLEVWMNSARVKGQNSPKPNGTAQVKGQHSPELYDAAQVKGQHNPGPFDAAQVKGQQSLEPNDVAQVEGQQNPEPYDADRVKGQDSPEANDAAQVEGQQSPEPSADKHKGYAQNDA